FIALGARRPAVIREALCADLPRIFDAARFTEGQRREVMTAACDPGSTPAAFHRLYTALPAPRRAALVRALAARGYSFDPETCAGAAGLGGWWGP
ncbi:hypothetical protein G3N55_07095, partial [Dissulfurirhabdus thermomarina]